MNLLLRTVILVSMAAIILAPASYSSRQLIVPGTGDSQILLQAAAREFMGRNPGVVVSIPESVGSIGGIKRVISGESELGRIARNINPHEQQLGLKMNTFAYSPVVFVANLPEQCVDDLSSAEAVAIYSGEISFWHELGDCPKQKIYVANREEGDSSRKLLEDYLSGFNEIESFAGEIVYSTPETLQIIEEHPYTIGYLPSAILKGSKLQRLSIDGHSPEPGNLTNRSYPYAVPLSFVWKDKLSDSANDFVNFMFSSQGQKLVRSHGAVPMPAKE